MLADVFRRRPLHMRDLVTHALPMLVEAPAERRQPAEAGLDQHDLEVAILLEQPLEDHARDHRLLAGRVLGHLLDVERGPAGVGHRPARIAEHVDADRQSGLDGCLIDRPVAAPPVCFRGAAQHEHLREVLRTRAALDLGLRGVRILIRHDHRSLEALVLRGPPFDLLLIRGECDGGGEFRVLIALRGRLQRIQDAVVHVVEVEQLLAHETKIAARQAAARRPRIAARRLRRDLRHRIGLGETVARPDAVGLQVRPPLIGEMLAVVLEQHLRVDVAIDDAVARLLRARGTNLDVHGRLSWAGDEFSRSYVASGFSTSILRCKPCGIPFGTRSSPSNCQCGKSDENNSISSDLK